MTTSTTTKSPWPARAESRSRFVITLIVYTIALAVVFVNFPKVETVQVKFILVGLAVGIVIGVMRETSYRLKFKRSMKVSKLSAV